jgi:hypothetical protein
MPDETKPILPEYPKSRPLALSDKPLFDEAFKVDPPEICEYTFANLYAWRDYYQFTASAFNDLLIVHCDVAKAPEFFCPIGHFGYKKDIIKKIIFETGEKVTRVSEDVKGLLSEEDYFEIEHSPDTSDYLYKAKDLIELKGSKYDGKRNLIKKFKSNYKYDYVKIDMGYAKECHEFEEAWCLTKDCHENRGLYNEKKAFGEMVANFARLELSGGAVRVNGKMCALAIGEKLKNDTFVVHILKALPDMAGLYQLMHNEFLAREAANFEYVNMEEDLGLEGLRKAKSSYHPVNLVKKYTVKLAAKP